MEISKIREGQILLSEINEYDDIIKALNDKKEAPIERIRRAIQRMNFGFTPTKEYDKYLNRVALNISKKIQVKQAAATKKLKAL